MGVVEAGESRGISLLGRIGSETRWQADVSSVRFSMKRLRAANVAGTPRPLVGIGVTV